jgi:hypothetical protein
LKVNAANSTEWIIKGWDQRWRGSQDGGPDIADRLVAAEYLQKRGLYYSHLLLDGSKPAAGVTTIIHRNEAVAHYSYRNPDYDRHGAMTRLKELLFFWARDMGLDAISIGQRHDYKLRWAPERDRYMTFKVYPDIILARDRVSRSLRAVNGKLGKMIHGPGYLTASGGLPERP